MEPTFILGNNYFELIQQLKNMKMNVEDSPFIDNSFKQETDFFSGKVAQIEDEPFHILNAENGYNFIIKSGRPISGYDESLIKLPCMEGDGYLISYCLVEVGNDTYIPAIEMTFNFYTKSKIMNNNTNSTDYINHTDDIINSSKEDFIKNRNNLLSQYTSENSVLLIDGPLIAGNMGEHIINLDIDLLKKNIIPIHIVKNSGSSLIIDNIKGLKNDYNSDFHYAYHILGNGGNRTALYYYQDYNSPNKNKYFCYIKPLKNTTPIRVEFHSAIYDLFKGSLHSIFDLIYYMLLAQGNIKNLQPRIIAIAEKYSREILKTIDVNKLLVEIGLKPTMNYTRFGW